MSDVYYVYTYFDPRTGSPIYVGMGKKDRAFTHWKKKANNRFFQNVLDKIRAEGLSPRIEFVALELTKDAANRLEFEMIALYGRRDLGLGPLTNLTDGGDGAKGLLATPERKEHQSRLSKHYWLTADREMHGAKISAAFAARTEEELRVVRNNIKNSRTEEVRAKIGKATAERQADPVLKAKKISDLQSFEANEKRKRSISSYCNTDEGRNTRRRAANIRWERVRAEKQLLLSDSCPERN